MTFWGKIQSLIFKHHAQEWNDKARCSKDAWWHACRREGEAYYPQYRPSQTLLPPVISGCSKAFTPTHSLPPLAAETAPPRSNINLICLQLPDSSSVTLNFFHAPSESFVSTEEEEEQGRRSILNNLVRPDGRTRGWIGGHLRYWWYEGWSVTAIDNTSANCQWEYSSPEFLRRNGKNNLQGSRRRFALRAPTWIEARFDPEQRPLGSKSTLIVSCQREKC